MRILIVFLALFIATPVVAQPAGSPVDRREKIKKKIRALRAYTLTEALVLDEQTAGKLFPLLAKYDAEFDKLLVARIDLQNQLASVDQMRDVKQVDKLIDDALANQRALWDTEAKRLAELRKILTPTQVARVMVVLPAVERKIQNQLRRAAGKAAQEEGGDEDVRPKKRRKALVGP